jgi:hypothetical protein
MVLNSEYWWSIFRHRTQPTGTDVFTVIREIFDSLNLINNENLRRPVLPTNHREFVDLIRSRSWDKKGSLTDDPSLDNQVRELVTSDFFLTRGMKGDIRMEGEVVCYDYHAKGGRDGGPVSDAYLDEAFVEIALLNLERQENEGITTYLISHSNS